MSKDFVYTGPTLAVDAVCITPEGNLILIERLNEPYGFALPGGIAEKGETTEEGVIREVYEEIGCKFTITGLHGVYSRPDRDPRGHTVSIVYVGWTGDTPVASSDAKAIKIVTVEEALKLPMTFDHSQILKDVFDVSQQWEDCRW